MSSVAGLIRNSKIYRRVRFLNPRILKIKFNQRLKEYALRGDGLTCNVCHKSYVAFLPMSTPPVLNSRCPNCSSFARTRLLWLYLNTEKKEVLTKSVKVLHFAPEPEMYKLLKGLNNIEYTCCDYFAPGYDYPKDCLNVDITNVPFQPQSFDFIFCAHVLEHVPDDHKAMTELYKILKPGGTAVLQVPMADADKTYEDFSITSPEERQKAFGQWDHVRWYGRDFADRLRKAGFTVEVNDLAARYNKNNEYGLQLNENLYVCTREK